MLFLVEIFNFHFVIINNHLFTIKEWEMAKRWVVFEISLKIDIKTIKATGNALVQIPLMGMFESF